MLDKVKNICFVIAAILLYTLAVIPFIGWIRNRRDLLTYLFYTCLCAPIFEEILFRHYPIQLTKKFDENLLPVTILFSSVIFGLMHGNGWNSVLVQGVGGLALSWVYVRNGYSYWSAVAVHSLWNLIAYYIRF